AVDAARPRSAALVTTSEPPEAPPEQRPIVLVGAAPVAERPQDAAAEHAVGGEGDGGDDRGWLRSLGTFDSLREPIFRWFFLGQMGQSGAMQLQQLLRGYLVFELTDSFAALGVMSLAQSVPMLTLSLPGGVLADRLPRKYLVQAGQAVNVANAVVLVAVIAGGWLRVEYLIASAVVQGIVMSLMMPARQSMIPDIVAPHRLTNAIALNSAGMQSMRLFAPGLGGAITAWAGADWGYGLTAVLYLVALLGIVPIPTSLTAPAAHERAGGVRSAIEDGRESIRYIARDPTMRTLLAVNLATVVLAMPYIIILPGFVKTVFDGGAGSLGILLSITGVGSLAGSLVIASLPDRRRGLLLMASSFLSGIGLFAFAVSSSFWLSAGILIVVGVGTAGRLSLSNVLVQAYVDPRYRGRVMSIYMTQFSLLFIGAFFIGLLAEAYGVQQVMAGVALALMVTSAAVVAFVPRMRRLD
ncbi:MAG: MFS transporter, partial [Chloroflexi bacterium]|nr:MFS transporter [Chloroflexota bacterium]